MMGQRELPVRATRFRAPVCAAIVWVLLLQSGGLSSLREWACWAQASAETPSRSDTTAEQKIRALQDWRDGRTAHRPADWTQLVHDPNPRVRMAALEAAAVRKPAEGLDVLIAALGDQELQVRLAAIAGLGRVGGTKAQAALRGVLEERGERVRAAAVEALAATGDEGALMQARKDPSWRVRRAVADSLARFPNGRSAQLARQLLHDPSAEVQTAVVRSVARWPWPMGGPVLLEALQSTALLTRSAAAEHLAALWPAAAGFPAGGPASERAEALRQLQSAYARQFASGLDGFGPGWRLETEQASEPRPAERAAVARLASADVAERRRGALELLGLSRDQPLAEATVSQLAATVSQERDPLVWQRVFAAVADDAGPAAIRLAYAGARHGSAEVRRAACEHLARHPSPAHQHILLRALGDSHGEVVRVAVRALGLGGELSDRQAVKRLLASADEMVRVEAATTLARLGDPAGPPALERLAYSTDPTIRRQVALAMGQVPNPSYTATLVRLLDDRYSVRLAALESLPKVTGRLLPPLEGGVQETVDEKVFRWKQMLQK